MKLSIVITNYNKGERIIKLLNQLHEQTLYKPFIEVIVVDDKSTDGSRESIIEYLRNRDEEDNAIFKLHLNESNQGPGLARNRGLDLCTGEWITFIDGDDEIKPAYIGTLLHYANTTDADMVSFDYEIHNCIDDEEVEPALNSMLWTKLFRGEIFYKNNIRVDESKYKGMVFSEDDALLYLFMSKTDKYLKIKDKLIIYNWGIGICNFTPDRYEDIVPVDWNAKNRWLFDYNQSDTVIDFFITSKCNRNCSNCIEMLNEYKPCERKHYDINELKARLDYILPYVEVISILGGETFLYPDLLELIKYVKDSGVFSIYVYTNGSIEPDNLQEILDVMDSRFTISISKYPGAKVFDYTKYKLPYGVKWRVTESDWFYCGPLKENNLPKTCPVCTPKTFLNKGDKIYLCHRIGMLDQLGIAKPKDNEWCYVKDFKTFKDTFTQDFTESCKYCLVGTDKCIDIPSGS